MTLENDLMRMQVKHLRRLIREVVTVPEPFRTEEEWAIFDAIVNDPSLAGALSVETLNLDELKPTQDMSQTGTKAWSSGPITVFDNGLGKYIIDGHHRFKSARSKGVSTIDAHVLTSHEPLTVPSAGQIMQMGVRDIVDAMHSSDRAKFAPKS